MSTLVAVNTLDKVYMLSLACLSDKCGAVARLGHHQRGTTVGAFTHCPVCGGPASQFMDNDATYWEAMADLYKLTPELVELLYSDWDRQEYHKFSDYVEFMKKNAGL